MRTRISNPLLLVVLVVVVHLLVAGRLSAQTFTALYSFSPPVGANSLGSPINSDGALPSASLTLSGKALYGTALQGGDSGGGTVFSVNTDGTGFATLHSFTDGIGQNSSGAPINVDGASPAAGLILSGNTLYGTASSGGASGNGTIFNVNTDGSGFTTLHSFTDPDGTSPLGGLIISGTTLYGTAFFGGGSGKGTVFAINTDGSGFNTLHSFSGSDGASPSGYLTLSSNTVYGTTYGGGSGYGTLFKINTDGTDFTSLHTFTGDNDGAYPSQAALVLRGGTLYGAAKKGGTWGYGTLFAINTDGSGFTVLYNFTGGNDGSTPEGLILSGNTLYGTTFNGGASGRGTVFAVSTQGSGFTTLHSFIVGSNDANNVYTNSEGINPTTGVIFSGSTLYGAAAHGGGSGNGTIFSISLAMATSSPQLTITPIGANMILTWPTNAIGFTLQSSTSPAPPVWTTNLPAPLVANGLYMVTNPISGTQQFFRLSQ